MPFGSPTNLSQYVPIPQRTDGYIILAVYVLAVLIALVSARFSFAALSRRQWGLFGILLLASVPLNLVLTVQFSSAVPLLGLLPVLLAGSWVGVAPAMLVGIAAGMTRWLLLAGRITQPAEIALFAFAAAFFMQQHYRGRLVRLMRRPIMASGFASVFATLLLFPALIASAPGDALTALDYAVSSLLIIAIPLLAEGILNGLISQFAYLAFPTLRRSLYGTETPFYARSLNRRMLWSILPIVFVVISFQVYFVARTAVEAAQRQAVAQLGRNAQAAAEQIDSFFVDGQALLEQFASDDRLLGPPEDAIIRQEWLTAAIGTVAFFDELLLVDAEGQIDVSVRVGEGDSVVPAQLTAEELALLDRAVDRNAPQRTDVHHDAQEHVMIAFLQPLDSSSGADLVLIGRTRFDINPAINLVKKNLSDTAELGIGYLIDRNDRIIVHPDATLELTTWIFDQGQTAFAVHEGGGRAYLEPFRGDQPRRFIFVQEVSGTPWTVAVELPYNTILNSAAQISSPLVVMFAVIMIGALILLPLVSRLVTLPLAALSRAARGISQGELDQPVPGMGQDEVGQLSMTFEGMRRSLKARLDDLSLLLRVSENSAAALDLERGIPPILEGARQVSAQDTRATVDEGPEPSVARLARLILFDGDTQPINVMTHDEGSSAVSKLDSELARITTRDERPLLIENVMRSHGALDPKLVGPGVRSIIALRIVRKDRILGVMWLGYPEPRRFATSEVDLLVTLAGQAAVLIENARLYEAAEGGRKRLQAVLSSTSDAVLVTDRGNRILLCNPAAEIAFGIPPGQAIGQTVSEVIDEVSVVDMLTNDGASPTRTAEISMPDGRTLYGSASTIVAGDEQPIGRVAVLRDITHLKELGELKDEFVNTVSHDLRAPLTYMRGYVTMTTMVGELDAKQQEYLDKITTGIDQMTELIDDLLDLGRIDAGIGIRRQTVALSDVVGEVVTAMRSQAAEVDVKLNFDAKSSREIQVDAHLLKHAISNYIENAIKYARGVGDIHVRVEEKDGHMIVYVVDSGIGIAPADQAQLFDKFYRVKRRDTIDIKGTGLGLAIVKSIAEWHGGYVGVNSQLGKGAVFYIAIPIISE